VDSSDMAFQIAGQLALKDAASKAPLLLLEPVDEVHVLIGDEYVGAVMSDLSSRRGRVLGTEPVAGGRTLVKAEIPELEIPRYAIDLRSISHGTGTFSRTYLRHEPMPSHLADKVIEAVQAAAEAIMRRFEFNKRNPYGPPRLLPATLDRNWKSAEPSSCLTGNAQIAIVWMKLYRSTGDARFLNAALKIVDQVKATQSLRSRHPGIRGGVAGAWPIWRCYERLAYPNWAAKFLADAIMIQESIMQDLDGTRP